MKKYQVILIRHGESTWNAENRFTGWFDCPLTTKGEQQAIEAGKLLKQFNDEHYLQSQDRNDPSITRELFTQQPENSHIIDLAFTSMQKRAIKTLWLLLEQIDYMYIPIIHAWQLNERHYGALEGLNKQVTKERYGEAQVQKWRRSYETIPPYCDEQSEYHPKNDSKYCHTPIACTIAGESLKVK